MRRRRGLAVAGIVVAVGVWLGTVGVAWGSYNVTPSCTFAEQTTSCSSGWYTGQVQLFWTWTPNDGGTPISGCVTQSYANDIRTGSSCTVTGLSGTTSVDQPINVEMSNPTAGASPSRPPDSNGWYNHPVVVSFGGSAFSGIASCSSNTYSGPDTPGTAISGSCTDNAGKVATAELGLHYDATPPSITAGSASRRPDHRGWYNHPVAFAFRGTDATSGIGTCSHFTYSGPDSGGASITGSCADRAGNVATLALPLRYDSGRPSLDVHADRGDATVTLHWRTSGDVAPITSLTLTRKPGLKGSDRSVLHRGNDGDFRDRNVRNGVRYRYTITAVDQAGNRTLRTIEVVPGAHLLSPAMGAHTLVPPLLSWTGVRDADYYNVQLYRGKSKLLSIWPKGASLQLQRSWRFEGHRYRLGPGRYRWYVWPGFGPRAATHYGRLIGKGAFVVTPKT